MARTPRFPLPRIRRPAADRRARRPRLVLQSLEDRAVPAGTHIDISNGNDFTITNSAGEAIQLTVGRTGGNYVLQIANSTFNIDAGDAGTIQLSNGDKTATIDASDVGTFEFALGDMDDTLTVGTGSLDQFVRVTVHGGTGDDDRLVVDDSADNNSLPYAISNTLVTRDSATFRTEFDDMDQVSLTCGTGNNTINLNTVDPAVVLTVDGNSGNDQVNLNSADPNVQLTVKGSDGANDQLTITDPAGALNYTITGTTIDRGPGKITYETLEGITVNAAGAANKFTIQSSAPETSFPALTLHGNGGSNELHVDDTAVTNGKTYAISATQVTRTGSGAITFSEITTLEVLAGSGNDTLEVSATNASATVTINAGTGDDTVKAGAGSLDSLGGSPTLKSGGGSDTLLVNDSSDTTIGNQYTIDDQNVIRAAGATPARTFAYAAAGAEFDTVVLSAGTKTQQITVSGTAQNTGITVNTGNDGVLVLVNATAANSPVAVNGGTGDDTVRVGNNTNGLSDLLADVTVNTGGGTADQLELKDAAYATPTTYTVTSAEVTSTDATRGTVRIKYSGAAGNLSISTGAAANAINIEGTATGTSLTVNGGLLKDTITVGTGTLDNIGGPIAINAGGLDNVLKVNDKTDNTAIQTYGVQDKQVTRNGSLAITYNQVSDLTLDVGTGTNTITVGGQTTGTGVAKLTVNGNVGEDTFNVTGEELAAESKNTFVGQGDGNPDGSADTFTVSPAVAAVSPAKDVVIELQGGESGANPDPVDHFIAKAFTNGVLDSDLEDSFVTFPFEVAAGQTAKSPISFTGMEDVEFDSEAVTPPDTPGADTLVVTFTGTNSGTFQLNNNKERKFKNANQVTWDGGNGTDTLTVIDAATTGQTYNFSPGSITRSGSTLTYSSAEAVSVTGGSGNDTFTVSSTAAAVTLTVDGGAGDDTVRVGGGSLDGIAGPVNLVGGLGNDTFVVNDSTDTTDNTYVVTDTTVSRNGGSPVLNYTSGFEAVSVSAGTGNDALVVEATTAAVSVAVDAGAGNDAISLGQANSLASLAGLVNVAGGTGTDSLALDDSGATAPGAYIVTGTTVNRAGSGTITYATIENIALNTTTSDDAIAVRGTAAGAQFFINAGLGNDAVSVSSLTGTLDDLDGPLTVIGGGQADLLSINESGGPADTVTVFAVGNTISGNAGGGWTVNADLFGGGISVLTGAQADTVNVVKSIAGLPLTVDTGLGNDSVSVGGGLLANLGGLPPVLVAGLNDIDTLTVNDADSTVAGIYAITSADVSRIDGTPVTLPYFSQGFEQLVLRAGTQDDLIFVQSTANLKPVTVQGGGGADTVVAGEGGTLDELLAPVKVEGGAGDSLIIDDSADLDPNVYVVSTDSFLRTNGLPVVIDFTSVDQVALRSGFASDIVAVVGTAAGTLLTIDAGLGDDLVTVGAGNSLDSVLGPVVVDGGAGIDRLAVDDSANPLPNAYTVSNTRVSRTAGSVTIDYSVDQLAVNAGTQDDTIDIVSTSVPTTVGAGAGSDSVTVGAGTLDNLAGPLALDAGADDIDTLTVDDSLDTTNNLYSVNNLAVSRSDGGISFDYPAEGFEQLELLAGTGADRIDVATTAPGIPVTANAGIGDDTIRVGGGSLDGIQSAVGVDGGGGTDWLVVDDQNDATANDYTVEVDLVTRAGSPVVAIGFAEVDQLSLLAGLGNDNVTVVATAADMTVDVFGGDGNDLINAGGGTLDNLLGSVNTHGGPLDPDADIGADTLVVDDSTDGNDNAYSIHLDTVSRTGGTPVSVGYLNGFESVSLLAGEGDDSIAANSATGVPVTADGGAGDDSFALQFLSGAVRGGAGDDTITGDDTGRQYAITGPDSGSIAGILGGGFTQVENLTAGTSDDVFVFVPGGTLSGVATGGAGRDTINGDSGNNIFQLTGSGSGSIDVLLGSFNTIEVLNGGAGNDELVVTNTAPANALARFDGEGNNDTVNFADRSGAQTLAIRTLGASGYELNGGTAANGTSAIISDGVFNIDKVIGSLTSNTDILASALPSPLPVRRDASWLVKAGADASFVRPDSGAAFTPLVFENFEQLVGSPANDTFTVDLSAGNGFTSSLLIRGGVQLRDGGTDSLTILGTAKADTFTMLHHTQLWPTGSVLQTTSESVAGVQVDSEQPAPPRPRILYDLIEKLDLQGDAGNDTFRVDPGSKLPRFPRPRFPDPRPLYGLETQSLTLEGGVGADRFEVVPDRPGNKFPLLPTLAGNSALVRPGVTINVYGLTTTTPASTIEHDQLFVYRLAQRIKANFPNGDAKPSGPRSHTLWLWFLGYSPVKYFDMWRVTATINNTPEPTVL